MLNSARMRTVAPMIRNAKPAVGTVIWGSRSFRSIRAERSKPFQFAFAMGRKTGGTQWTGRKTHQYHHNQRQDSNGGEEASKEYVLWGGRIAGLLVASGGVVAIGSGEVQCKDAFNPGNSWFGLEGVISSEVEMSCRELVQRSKLGTLDLNKLEEVFLSARGLSKGESKTEYVTLSEDDFAKVMGSLGISDKEVVDTLFEVFDTDRNKRIDWEEWSLGMTALTQKDASAKLQTIFDFCDLNHDGEVSKAELQHALTALLTVASRLTKGKFLRKEVLESLEVSEADVKAAVTANALQDIFQRPTAADIPDNSTVSFGEFQRWAESRSPSSAILLQLFDVLGGIVSETGNAHVLHPERYGGYTFLLGRLAALSRLAASKARYLAYSSDVGEAFRPVVPAAAVNATYAVAIGYCCYDIGQHALKEQQKPQGEVVRAVVHQSTFHGLASIGLPFFIIHSAVHAAHTALHKAPPPVARWGPTAVGLILIPVLPFVCDEPVEHALEYAFDKAWPSRQARKEH